MLTINELKNSISDYDISEQEEIIKWATPFYDFTDYMKENFNKDLITIEDESAKYSIEVLPEYMKKVKDSDSPIQFIIGISADIYEKYAISYGYDKAPELHKSMLKYMELIAKKNIKIK